MADNEEQITQDTQLDDEQEQTKTEQTTEQPDTIKQAKELYNDLGIDAKVPTGKTVGRPKSSKVRAEDANKEDSKGASTNTEKQEEAKDDKDKDEPKDAQDSANDGDTGDKTDKKSSKDDTDDGEVPEKSEKTSDGVREDEPETAEDTESSDERGGKRPGKSSPAIERRFQQLSSEIHDRDKVIDDLQTQLREAVDNQRKAQQDSEDPKYTLDDFREVRDEYGDIVQLDSDQAELAWRRWQEGYNQRQAERDAERHRQETEAQQQANYEAQLMKSSMDAYDTLASIRDSYPQLDENSDKFDRALSDTVIPVIEQSIIYQPGTEPGNEQGNSPVIIGLRMDPKVLLGAIDAVKDMKRDLPLNGLSDSIDNSTGGYSVPRSKSSDPMINQANELYQSLGIKKRL